MKKALIFSPYLETIGGGEEYLFHVAKFLEDNNFQVEFAWKNTKVFQSIDKYLNISLSSATINSQAYKIFTQKSSLWSKFKCTREYDLVFLVSDGSIPFLFSKKNIAISNYSSKFGLV